MYFIVRKSYNGSYTTYLVAASSAREAARLSLIHSGIGIAQLEAFFKKKGEDEFQYGFATLSVDEVQLPTITGNAVLVVN